VRAAILLFPFVVIAAALACGSSSTSSACAAGTEAIYRDEAKTSPWPLYCPSLLPSGTVVDHVDFGNSLSTVWFSLSGGGTMPIIQGHELISPRTATGFAQAERDVRFGDVPAQLFMTSDGPMIRSVAEEDVTRAILAPNEMDPDLAVKIAESMRRVD
jgi:hypothetical protein